MQHSSATAAHRPFYARLGFQQALSGYLFAAPAILGMLFFTAAPVAASFYLSFTNYDIVSPPAFTGLQNYVKLATTDTLFRHSLTVTLYYSALSIPLSLVTAFLVAMLMNQKVRGIVVYRVVWYLPALVPVAANAALWRWMLNRDFGLINFPLIALGFAPPGWLVESSLTVPALVMVHLWGIGNSVLIYLAGLQGVPQHLYEAAEIDGSNWWHKFRHVTIPMMSAIIFFNLIMGIIGSFQVFTLAYVIFTPGGGTGTAGPENAALFYVFYLYRNAFQYFKMGYAAALAWVLFLIILALTILMFRFQNRWVYYEGGKPR
ncbi:MAG: sugar ABC transporter permease [Chloroflexi bacterium]|nr:sugar ABC transporter permease [Chloroflexota bacterium]